MSFQRRYVSNAAAGEKFKIFATCLTPRSNLAIGFYSILPIELLFAMVIQWFDPSVFMPFG